MLWESLTVWQLMGKEALTQWYCTNSLSLSLLSKARPTLSLLSKARPTLCGLAVWFAIAVIKDTFPSARTVHLTSEQFFVPIACPRVTIGCSGNGPLEGYETVGAGVSQARSRPACVQRQHL